jgi:calcium-dependent protein kinase
MDHPNVVKLYEIFDEDDFMYLVLELMSGGEVISSVSFLTLSFPPLVVR